MITKKYVVLFQTVIMYDTSIQIILEDVSYTQTSDPQEDSTVLLEIWIRHVENLLPVMNYPSAIIIQKIKSSYIIIVKMIVIKASIIVIII